ncbi:MAG TPA: TadE family protein [Polyangiaceae bacterium]|nr:TadE family protein [Polyangiaceae bacterium]
MRTLARLRRCDVGAVYVEFLIAFFPVFLLFLGTVQLAFVRGAHLVVREAAARACRSAIVILDDDPDRHSTPRGALNGPAPEPSFFASMQNALGLGEPAEQGPAGTRLAAIRKTAYVPLAALSPPIDWILGTLGESAGNLNAAVSTDAARFALGFGVYNLSGAIVTLRAAPGSDELATDPIAPDAKITVHVTYLYYCAVPLVSALICDSLPSLLGGNAASDALDRLRADPTAILDVLEQLQEDVDDAKRLARELTRAELPALLAPLLLGSGRFAALEAEMTLPNQGARYHGGYRD